ncbi:YggT family protein [Streptococcus marmotae]|uniref:YggT family protein n=1 Tax=Streptococcus marmotae TaxID=1825069 RepID=UPI000837814D|nr:YggT family protein [Streptococcus marmotae]
MAVVIFILLKALEIYSYILFGYAILSWVPDLYDTFIGRTLSWLAQPVLTPFRKLKLHFFGLDWTIVVVAILLNVLERLLIDLLPLFL